MGLGKIKNVGKSVAGAFFGKGGGSEQVQAEALDPKQLALRNSLIDYYSGLIGKDDLGAGDALTRLMAGRQFEYDPDAVNRYYQTSVYNPALRDFQENQVPALQSGLAKSGLLRSSWGARNMQKQQSDFANKMLENRAGLQEAERQDVRKLNATGQLGGLSQYNSLKNANNNIYGTLLGNSKQVLTNQDSGSMGLLSMANQMMNTAANAKSLNKG